MLDSLPHYTWPGIETMPLQQPEPLQSGFLTHCATAGTPHMAFLLTSLLTYNSHTTKITHLKDTQHMFRKFSPPKKETPHTLAITLHCSGPHTLP